MSRKEIQATAKPTNVVCKYFFQIMFRRIPGLVIPYSLYIHYCLACLPGRFGENCSIPCRYPSYGSKCQKECNCKESHCSSVTGCMGM